jgi:ABC-2 type transport system permease protein
LTYIIGTGFLQALVLSSRSYTIGDEINEGNLSNYLIKPMNYFMYWLAKDIGDKAMNITFAVGELIILYSLLKPPLFIQTNFRSILLFIVTAFFAASLYFLCNLILGMIGFWSPEVWAPRFIFMIVINFFSGGFFPLDVLPAPLYTFFSWLPFQYLLYFPIKVYLGQVRNEQIIYGFLIETLWLLGLYLIVELLWHKGLKMYTAQGR